MEFKLYRCEHCGNIAYKVVDSGVPMICCGEEMGEMKANTGGGAPEKHVPVLTKKGNEVTVSVAAVTHPMEEKHYIPIIAAVNEDTAVIRTPKPGDEPVLHTTLDGKVTAYEWCNLHGFYSAGE